jgi:hypothetical protein
MMSMCVRESGEGAHHEEVKIALHSLWYHHSLSGDQNYTASVIITPIDVMIPEAV